MKKENLILRIAKEKCPICGQGQIFHKKKSFFEFPKMKAECDNCHYRFEREPGYFLGAMYISYGLAVLQGIATFLICYFFFPKLPTLAVIGAIISVIILLSMRNFRISRVVYMYIFPN
jgi:uncharacterized protein (DUF983 family)